MAPSPVILFSRTTKPSRRSNSGAPREATAVLQISPNPGFPKSRFKVAIFLKSGPPHDPEHIDPSRDVMPRPAEPMPWTITPQLTNAYCGPRFFLDGVFASHCRGPAGSFRGFRRRCPRRRPGTAQPARGTAAGGRGSFSLLETSRVTMPQGFFYVLTFRPRTVLPKRRSDRPSRQRSLFFGRRLCSPVATTNRIDASSWLPGLKENNDTVNCPRDGATSMPCRYNLDII